MAETRDKEMSTAELAEKVVAGDLDAFAGGWMLEKLAQTKVFGQMFYTGINVMDIERIGGAPMLAQAPSSSTTYAAGERALLLRQLPNTMRRKSVRLKTGDACPDFALVGKNDHVVRPADLRGTPFVLRLTRTVAGGIICPACLPGMDDLIHLKEPFEKIGVKVLVVVTAPRRQAQEMEELLGLNYTLYSNKDYSLFEAFDARFCAGPPMPVWSIVDAGGVIRYLWRSENSTLHGMKPHPRGPEILEEAKRCLGK